MKNYLPFNHIIKIGEVYKNDFGTVEVINKIGNEYEVKFLVKPYNLSETFIVSENGKFGNQYNNPHTLQRLTIN